MSAWKLALRMIYEHGEMSSHQLDIKIGGVFTADTALYRAKNLGLLSSPGRGGDPKTKPWRLTPLGMDFCEGRAHVIHDKASAKRWGTRGPERIVATWLMSLPKGIRIEQRGS